MIKQYQNKKWLEEKYWNKELSKSQIAKLCNIGNTTILNWMRKYNIPRRSVIEAYNTKDIRERRSKAMHLAQANHCNLSPEAINFINGELLGDGCLQSFSKYSASFGYTFKYQEYAQYIKNSLQSYGIKCGKISKYYNKDKRCNDSISYRFYSYRYVELLPFYNRWYINKKKIIPKDIRLNPIALKQFYLGDGMLSKSKKNGNKPYIVLCTNNFPIVDIEWLISKLNDIGFKATRRPSRNEIGISTYSTKDFLNYIGKCPVKCYNYKFAY